MSVLYSTQLKEEENTSECIVMKVAARFFPIAPPRHKCSDASPLLRFLTLPSWVLSSSIRSEKPVELTEPEMEHILHYLQRVFWECTWCSEPFAEIPYFAKLGPIFIHPFREAC
ncbi:hypothetical protein EMCRGX_G002889 [Ephydatia muelleri]